MKRKSYIDDEALVKIIRMIPEDVVWQTTFRQYREPFVRFFEKEFGLSSARSLQLLNKAFAIFYLDLRKGNMPGPLRSTLFTLLLQIGKKLYQKECPDMQKINQSEGAEGKKHYLEGNILLMLIYQVNEAVFLHVFNEFKAPTVNFINNKYGFINIDPEEIYGEAMNYLSENICEKKITTPLRSTLFTYFFKIARNRFLERARNNPDYIDLIDEQEWERWMPEERTVGADYLDYLENRWPILHRYTYNNEKELIGHLMDKIGSPCSDYLKLRFLHELRFRDLGKKIGKSETASRKAVFDCLKKLKKLLELPQN